MKDKIVYAIMILLVVVLALGVSAGQSASGTFITTTDRETGNFSPNCVDLYFPSNPTTGYSWEVSAADDGIVAVRDQYFADSGDLGMTGVGGTHWFHFSGLREGTTSVTFRYVRAWDPETAVYTYVYRLTVDEAGNVLIWGVEVGNS